jgi:hypothetical protein
VSLSHLSRIALGFGVWAVLGGVFLIAYRWIRRRSATLATMFAAGVILRLLISAALLAISMNGWPIRRSLQLGGGFWALAPDARIYFDLSSAAVEHGLRTVSDVVPSPFYVRALAAWMSIFGISPVTAVLLNVLCYVAAAASIVGIAEEQSGNGNITGRSIALVAVTFSPALLIFGAQPLKDALCATLIIGAICSGRVWWAAVRSPDAHQGWRAAGAAIMMAICTYGIAGVRVYVAAFMILAAAAAALFHVIFTAPAGSRWPSASKHIVLVGILWLAFMKGAGPLGASYESDIASGAMKPSSTVRLYDTARAGFVTTGGATSVQFATTAPDTLIGKFEQLAQGSAVLFVPVSLLRAASIVKFSGGEGLLLITDVDTIVADAAVLASVYLLFASARRDGIVPSSVFALVLAILITCSLAYVVTNYGTLFRLRLLGVVPFCMLAALSDAPSSARNRGRRAQPSPLG